VIEDEPQAPILPELQNGQYVTLSGYVSRGNQNTGTIGFQYNGHTVTCEPKNGMVSDYIGAHYKNCEITGYVIRTPREEVELGKRDRPKLIFDKIEVSGNRLAGTQQKLEL
jgi:hypothetical protein